MDTLSIAATGMFAQQVAVEVIANNLANMNTTGFKRRDTEFSNLLVEDLDRGGFTTPVTDSVVPAGVESGYGLELAASSRIHKQGNLKGTGNNFHLAIQGQVFFEVTRPTGETDAHGGGASPAFAEFLDREVVRSGLPYDGTQGGEQCIQAAAPYTRWPG